MKLSSGLRNDTPQPARAMTSAFWGWSPKMGTTAMGTWKKSASRRGCEWLIKAVMVHLRMASTWISVVILAGALAQGPRLVDAVGTAVGDEGVALRQQLQLGQRGLGDPMRRQLGQAFQHVLGTWAFKQSVFLTDELRNLWCRPYFDSDEIMLDFPPLAHRC